VHTHGHPLDRIGFNEAHLTVAEWREASLQAASQGMDDDLLAFAAGPPPSPSAPDAPADPVQPCAEGAKEDVRELVRRRLDAAWADARQQLARMAFEPYETGRLAALLEQAAAAVRTELNRRTTQPLARRRPLVPPPPRSQEGDGLLRPNGRAGRPRAARERPDLDGAVETRQRLAKDGPAPADESTLSVPHTKRCRTPAVSQASQGTQEL
jgi:hypothetical protein